MEHQKKIMNYQRNQKSCDNCKDVVNEKLNQKLLIYCFNSIVIVFQCITHKSKIMVFLQDEGCTL